LCRHAGQDSSPLTTACGGHSGSPLVGDGRPTAPARPARGASADPQALRRHTSEWDRRRPDAERARSAAGPGAADPGPAVRPGQWRGPQGLRYWERGLRGPQAKRPGRAARPWAPLPGERRSAQHRTAVRPVVRARSVRLRHPRRSRWPCGGRLELFPKLQRSGQCGAPDCGVHRGLRLWATS
jgi:hypothetical protein